MHFQTRFIPSNTTPGITLSQYYWDMAAIIRHLRHHLLAIVMFSRLSMVADHIS